MIRELGSILFSKQEGAQGLVQNGRLSETEVGGKGTFLKKSGLFHTRSSVFVEGPGSVMQVTSHVLIRKFQIPWLKFPFLGEVETVVKS